MANEELVSICVDVCGRERKCTLQWKYLVYNENWKVCPAFIQKDYSEEVREIEMYNELAGRDMEEKEEYHEPFEI